METIKYWVRRDVTGISLLTLVALIIGYFLSQAWIPQPKLGIIKVSGDIGGKADTDRYVNMLRFAQNDPAIKAVVVEISSPGGDATGSTEVFMNLVQLKESKPVVASIDDFGASGAYLIASGANFIYGKPSSFVGSLGVAASFPQQEGPTEETVTTGPFKPFGFGREQFVKRMELLKESLIGAVISERGSRLKLTKEEMSTAEVFVGLEALNNGLIDAIGSGTEAQAKAADLARIANYKLVDITEKFPKPSPFFFLFEAPTDSLPKFQYRYAPLGSGQ
ncbi:MAG: S49 family peptidase [Chloroflexi bacterium]|nr:S49 family peptidase [Chloroflexota bacterium]